MHAQSSGLVHAPSARYSRRLHIVRTWILDFTSLFFSFFSISPPLSLSFDDVDLNSSPFADPCRIGWNLRFWRLYAHRARPRNPAALSSLRIEHHDGPSLRRRGSMERRADQSGSCHQSRQGNGNDEREGIVATFVSFLSIYDWGECSIWYERLASHSVSFLVMMADIHQPARSIERRRVAEPTRRRQFFYPIHFRHSAVGDVGSSPGAIRRRWQHPVQSPDPLRLPRRTGRLCPLRHQRIQHSRRWRIRTQALLLGFHPTLGPVCFLLINYWHPFRSNVY